jgi:hypothetical protein
MNWAGTKQCSIPQDLQMVTYAQYSLTYQYSAASVNNKSDDVLNAHVTSHRVGLSATGRIVRRVGTPRRPVLCSSEHCSARCNIAEILRDDAPKM